MIGKVKKIVSDRGFGFITAEDGRDYFFHSSGLLDLELDDLSHGDQVSFSVEPDGPKGPRASNVERTPMQ